MIGDIIIACSVEPFHSMKKCKHELLTSCAQRSDSLRAHDHDFVLFVYDTNLCKEPFFS